MTAQQVIDRFGLIPNDDEGGYFAPVYTSSLEIDNQYLPGFKSASGKHPICGAIYYFLDADKNLSVLHKTTGDMLYSFYSGDPVETLLIYPKGSPNESELYVFSNDIDSGGHPMKVIPGGTWMGSRLMPGGEYALMGVSMAPAFEPEDYAIANQAELIKEYPNLEELIKEFSNP